MAAFKNKIVWQSKPGSEWVGASIGFSLRMMLAAIVSLLALCVVIVLVARLDVAYFESNGMMASEDIREAFYYQVFDVDAALLGMLLAGFVAVGVISFLFSKSQFDYFRRLADGFRTFAGGDGVPNTQKMGRMGPFAGRFFAVLQKRLDGHQLETLRGMMVEARVGWPTRPMVSWSDLLQFTAVSCLLGLFFSACCAMIYFRVSNRVVELSGQLTHFQTSAAPMFLNAQVGIMGVVVGMLLALTILGFMLIGYRFAWGVAQSDYAILRDMRVFMEGDLHQRLFLRFGDPARAYVEPMNKALEHITAKLAGEPGAQPKTGAS